jgi:hypothetical protein
MRFDPLGTERFGRTRLVCRLFSASNARLKKTICSSIDPNFWAGFRFATYRTRGKDVRLTANAAAAGARRRLLTLQIRGYGWTISTPSRRDSMQP